MARKKMTDAEVLKANAEALLAEQQQVLAHAGTVVRQASRELGRYAQDDLYPRVAASTRQAARGAREKLVDDVLPSVAAVIGSTMSVIDAARDQRLKNITKAVGAAGAAVAKGRKAAPAPVASSGGGGKYVVMGLGVAALIGIGYVVWQTFRADDELWIAEDDAYLEE